MEPSGDKCDKSREIIVAVLFCCFSLAAIGAATWWMSTATPPPNRAPSFSAAVTDTGSLDPWSGPVIRPAFGLALRVDNHMDSRVCRENATATVSYGGVVLGWGHVGDLCVDKGASAEVTAALSHVDVVLTDELRRSMALELRGAGELEVLVELRMLFPKGHQCESCVRDIFQYCRVRPGQGYSPCRCHALQITQISELLIGR